MPSGVTRYLPYLILPGYAKIRSQISIPKGNITKNSSLLLIMSLDNLSLESSDSESLDRLDEDDRLVRLPELSESVFPSSLLSL